MDNKLKEVVILHSNDIHGSFSGEVDDEGRLSRSIAQVAGFVAEKKKENPCTFYCVAGDAFQGSLIDSEFKGLSTVEILNMADIDAMALGNHELDYGITHMMFVAKDANFPIINANLKSINSGRNLFKPQVFVKRDDTVVQFIGLLTQDVVDMTRAEGLLSTFIGVKSAADEIKNVVERTRRKGRTPDLRVLLTHIGYEEDLKLARSLDPSLGIDVIVGGHSHTYPENAVMENGILVVQSGQNNTHIGELHAWVDDAGDIKKWDWKLVPVDEDHCKTDMVAKAMISTYELDIDDKYGFVLTRLKRSLDNFGRGNPTEFGQLITDIFTECLDVDIMLTAASSLRCYGFDMTVTLMDLRKAYPYDGDIYKVVLSGHDVKHLVRRFLRDEVLDEWNDAFFHTSKDLKIIYDRDTGELEISFKGEPVADDAQYTVGIQEFYYANARHLLDLSSQQLEKLGGRETICKDPFGLLKDYFATHKGLGGRIDDRIIIKGGNKEADQ